MSLTCVNDEYGAHYVLEGRPQPHQTTQPSGARRIFPVPPPVYVPNFLQASPTPYNDTPNSIGGPDNAYTNNLMDTRRRFMLPSKSPDPSKFTQYSSYYNNNSKEQAPQSDPAFIKA